MIAHIVLFKLKPDVTSNELQSLDQGLRSMKSIQGVVSVECGSAKDDLYPLYKPRHGEYNYALIVILADANALEYYDKDAYHDHVKKSFIFPIIDQSKAEPILAIDFPGVQGISYTKQSNISSYALLAVLGLGTIALFPWIRSRL